jgi:exodeoxyribonuclease VII small subunit
VASEVERKAETSFEGELENLEKVVDLLERGQLSLEESIELFESGIRSLKACDRILDATRGRIEVLTGSLGQWPAGPRPDGVDAPEAGGACPPEWRPMDGSGCSPDEPEPRAPNPTE